VEPALFALRSQGDLKRPEEAHRKGGRTVEDEQWMNPAELRRAESCVVARVHRRARRQYEFKHSDNHR
jgi:hypothetical protein